MTDKGLPTIGDKIVDKIVDKLTFPTPYYLNFISFGFVKLTYLSLPPKQCCVMIPLTFSAKYRQL